MVRESIGDDYCILSSKNGSLEWSTERVLQQLPFDKATNRVGAWNKTMVGKRGRKWSGGDFDIQTIQVWYVSCVTWYMAALSHLISCPLCSERFTYLVCICRWHLIFVITAPVRLSMIFTRKIRAGRFQLNTESCLIDSLPLTMVLVAQFLQHISVMVVKISLPKKHFFTPFEIFWAAWWSSISSFPWTFLWSQNHTYHTLPLLHNLLFILCGRCLEAFSRVSQVVLDVIRVGPTERRCEAGRNVVLKAEDAWNTTNHGKKTWKHVFFVEKEF